MYINLPFRFAWIRYTRPVFITLNIGVLESICSKLDIDYHQIGEYCNKYPVEFNELLMYHGYISGCIKLGKRVKYTFKHAEYWAKKITIDESAKYFILISELYGKLTDAKPSDEKKKP